jgi:hypothetical protein
LLIAGGQMYGARSALYSESECFHDVSSSRF